MPYRLTSLQKLTGGKQKLSATSKRGERTIRRLLILGAWPGADARRTTYTVSW
jgi:hypothetical protein